MTVSCRRSATGVAAGLEAMSCATAAPSADGAPQSAQNRLPGGFSARQAAHCHGSGNPQSPQNLSPLARLAPHCGQFARFPLFGPFTRSFSSVYRAPQPKHGSISEARTSFVALIAAPHVPATSCRSEQSVVFLTDRLFDDGLGLLVPIPGSASIADTDRNIGAAENIPFIGPLMKSDLPDGFDEPACLAKEAGATTSGIRHATRPRI
jgi:hypothetical protein